MAEDANVIPPEVWNDPWKREELLTRRRRVRREERLPAHLQRELDRSRSYPFRLNVLPGHEVTYRVGGWRKLETPQVDEPDFEGCDYSVRVREVFCWIRLAGHPVAAVSFRQIDADSVAPPNFWTAMDDESDSLARWAAVLLDAWQDIDFEVFAHGPVTELRDVWVQPRHPELGIWRPVAKALSERLMRKSSVLVAQAFPIEYGGRVPDGANTERAFQRRRSAMMRTAERTLGLKALPGSSGSKGYMWRPRPGLERVIEAPKYLGEWTSAEEA